MRCYGDTYCYDGVVDADHDVAGIGDVRQVRLLEAVVQTLGRRQPVRHVLLYRRVRT